MVARTAAIVLQAAVRMRSQRQQFLGLRAAAIVLQAAWQGAATRRALNRRRAAAVRLQACAYPFLNLT